MFKITNHKLIKKIIDRNKESDKQATENVQKDKPHLHKKILKISLCILSVLVLLVGIFIVYVHNSSFTVAFNEIKLKNYFNEKDLEKKIKIKGNTVSLEIPNDVLSTAFNNKIQEIKVDKGYKINGGYINTAENKAYINTTIHGLNIPISMDIKLTTGEREIMISFDNMMICNNELFSLSNQAEEFIANKLLKDKEILKINLDDYNVPQITSIDTITMESDNIVLKLNIDEQKALILVQDLINNKDNRLYEIYSKLDISNKKVLELTDKQALSNQDIELVLEDVLTKDEEVIKNILIITNEKKADEIFNSYSKYITHFNKDDIINEKNKLIIGDVQDDCRKVLNTVKKLPTDKYMVFYNDPYDIVNNKVLTIKELVNINNLGITEDIYNNMSLIVDYTDKKFMTVYKIDNNRYAVIDEENSSVIDNDKYLEYKFDEPLPNEVRYDMEIESIISEYFSTEVFIRYMNTDSKYAYVIASSVDNYQNYEKFALEKNDKWKIVATNINDLYRFSITHPGFNIKTITDNYIEDKIYRLSEEDKTSVLDQLRFRNIIPNKQDINIKYCAYDGDYISVLLTNNEEYVISIKYSYIDEICKKSEAINKWNDISQLILLQDKNIVVQNKDTEGKED